MVKDRSVRIEELPSWYRALFRPRENDRQVGLPHLPGLNSAYSSYFHTWLLTKKKTSNKRNQEKLTRYVAQRDQQYARPLRLLVDKKYDTTFGLDLMRLPVRAIRIVGAMAAQKLAMVKINTVYELATAPLKHLEATGVIFDKLSLAQSYAKDIIKHATDRNVVENPLPLEEILKPKYARTSIQDLSKLRVDAIRGISGRIARHLQMKGFPTKVGELHDASSAELIAGGISSHQAFILAEYTTMLKEYAELDISMTLTRPPSGTLRVLMFDGVLKLGQKVKPKDDDRERFEHSEYPLDDPNIGRPPEIVEEEPYVGYIICADEIIVAKNLTTKGNDLVLVAKKIQIGKSDPVTINTCPAEFSKPANIEHEGLDADNGGDLVFLSQGYGVLQGSTFLSSGVAGQDGGMGRHMNKPDYLEEGLHFNVPVRAGSVACTYVGTLFGGGQCEFHIDPDEWVYGIGNNFRQSRPIRFTDYNQGVFGSTVNITGNWTLWNSIRECTPLFRTSVDITDDWYPTTGKAGGYGGNPGKISLIMPDPSLAKGMDGLKVKATTGTDGNLGQSGDGGDCTPTEIRVGGVPVQTADYIRHNTIDRGVNLFRGESNQPITTDTFRAIDSTKLDTIPVVDNLKDSLAGVRCGADLLVSYAPNAKLKAKGLMRDKYIWGLPWPIAIFISVKRSGGGYTWFTTERVGNKVQAPELSSLGLVLSNAPAGESKPALPTEKRNLQSVAKNWYSAVYELVPEYPMRQYELADQEYRRGNFAKATVLYDTVLSFAEEITAFLEDHPDVVREASYRMDRLEVGVDYFGFAADTIIPTSPTRDYFPLNLIAAYTDTVEFYKNSIHGFHNSIETIEAGRATLRQFRIKHQKTIDDIKEAMATLKEDFDILESETAAIEQEILALYWQNQRLNGLLQRWAKQVDDKIKKLEKEKENAGPGFWEYLSVAWNVIQLVASIVAACFGIAVALASAVEAMNKLGELKNHINDLRIALGELHDNLDDWSFDQITDYIVAMGVVAKEIEAITKPVEKAWENAEKNRKELKKTFEEVRNKIDQLAAVDMSASEAVDFQNNVLLAEEIGVSGAMNYLQIQEQIYLNNDMLEVKYHSLEALTKRQVQLSRQGHCIAQELVAHAAESKYLDDVLADANWDFEQKSAALGHLIKVGQHSLDALMHLLARQARQLRFLTLETQSASDNYAYFINHPSDVGVVLDAKDQMIKALLEWIEQNNNIARLDVVLTSDVNYTGNSGGVTIIDPVAVASFAQGQYIRPARIMEIEPLRETKFVERLAAGVRSRRSDSVELTRLLISQFLVEENGMHRVIAPEALGFDVPPDVVATILNRERTHHPRLQIYVNGQLDDTTLVLAYVLARGGITLSELTGVFTQTSIPVPSELITRLEALRDDWASLSNEINFESIASLRLTAEAVQQALGDPAQMRTVLDQALTRSGQFARLGRFHLEEQDILDEVANSYDPDPDEAVLARILDGEPMNVAAAVVLLYADLDANALTQLEGEYAASPNALGDCISNLLKPDWNFLRGSVLEKQHQIQFHIRSDDYMGIPNASETYREMRYLHARAGVPSAPDFMLVKLQPDLYLRETSGGQREDIEIQFESSDDIVDLTPIATPAGLNIETVHFTDHFGRSILGKWDLSFTYKGNRPPLPPLHQIEVEFLYTYFEHS